MPRSPEELAQRNEHRKAKIKEVNSLVKKKNLTIGQACDEVGITKTMYYYDRTKASMGVSRKEFAKQTRKKAKLKVTEILPAAPMKASSSFLIFGAPSALAEFARSYE